MSNIYRRSFIFASTSAATQGLAILSGLAVVRVLPKDSYALYSIAVAAVAACAVLSDAGIRSTLLAATGRAHADGAVKNYSEQFVAALRARKRLLAIVTPALVALTAYLLVANHANLADTVICLALVATIAVSDATSGLLRVDLQVRSQTKLIQGILFTAAASRLSLVLALWMVPITWMPAFLAVQAVVAIGQRAYLGKATKRHVSSRAHRPAEMAPYVSALRHTLPHTIMVVAGPQVVNILLTSAGNTDAIAEIAALTRFGAAFVVLQQVTDNIIAPHVARLSTDRKASVAAASRVLAIHILLAGAFVACVSVATPFLLGLLGPEYADLQAELLIVTGGLAVTNVATYGIGSINHARGWTRWSWVYAPMFGIWLALSVSMLDLSTSIGAIAMFSSLAFVELATQSVRFAVGLHRTR